MSLPAPADPTARAAAFAALEATFDRIFVVTLARAGERQAKMRERLEGLRYAFHLGADKKDLDFAALERDGVLDQARARRVHRRGREMSPGEVGCALSHRQLYEATVREGWERVLVFEDDIVPRADALAGLPAALAELPPSWDLCYLGFMNLATVTPRDRAKQVAYTGLAALGLMKWSVGEVRRLLPRPYSPHLRIAGLHHGTHAYAFTRRGAERLLAAQTPVSVLADQLLIQLVLRGELEAYVALPSLFDQEDHLGLAGAYSMIKT